MGSTTDRKVRKEEKPGTLARAMRFAEILLEKKIGDVWVIDVAGLCGYADCLILGDAENERHMQAALEGLDMAISLPGTGFSPERGGRWTLLDLGDVVIDLFLHGTREIYRLEDLYSEAPIYVFDPSGKNRRVLPEERLSLYSGKRPDMRETGSLSP